MVLERDRGASAGGRQLSGERTARASSRRLRSASGQRRADQALSAPKDDAGLSVTDDADADVTRRDLRRRRRAGCREQTEQRCAHLGG